MKVAGYLGLLTIAVIGLTGCDVDKTQDGEMPKVNVEGGKLPKYDVKTADVDINKTTTTVTVPDIDISTEKKDISVPNVDVKMPNDPK